MSKVADLCAFALSDFEDQLILLAIQICPLLLDDCAEELSLQALLLDSKVDNHDLGADLRCVVRIACNQQLALCTHIRFFKHRC